MYNVLNCHALSLWPTDITIHCHYQSQSEVLTVRPGGRAVTYKQG